MSAIKMYFIFFTYLILISPLTESINVDTEFPVTIEPPKSTSNDYFGYSVAIFSHNSITR